MQRSAKLVLAMVVGILVTACAPTEQAVDPNEIRDRYEAYNAAFGAADAEGVAAFYADNAIRVASNGSVIDGVAAIREEISSFFGDNDYVLEEATAPDIQASGDLAVSLSVFREHWTPKAGGEMTQQVGHWLIVWQRQADGTWMITREMWAIEETEEVEGAV